MEDPQELMEKMVRRSSRTDGGGWSRLEDPQELMEKMVERSSITDGEDGWNILKN